MAKRYVKADRRRNPFTNPAQCGFIVSALVVALTVVGCGGSGLERAAVHGTVTVGGQPIQEGRITFLPCDGNKGPSAGTGIKDGKYELLEKGPAVGMNRVMVHGSRKTGRKIALAGSKVPTVDERVSIVPKQYTTPGSPLKYDVKSGELNIEVPGK